MALRAKFKFETYVFFMILLVKMKCLSKHNSARSAVKNLFTQPQDTRKPNKILRGEAADTTGK
jgi:hypothetical protein